MPYVYRYCGLYATGAIDTDVMVVQIQYRISSHFFSYHYLITCLHVFTIALQYMCVM